VCRYLEVTNRFNLRCRQCPRTYEDLRAAGIHYWDLFASIVDQFPVSARAVRMASSNRCWSRGLPRMVRYLEGIAASTSVQPPMERCSATQRSRADRTPGLMSCVVARRSTARAQGGSWQGINFGASSATCARFASLQQREDTHAAGFGLAYCLIETVENFRHSGKLQPRSCPRRFTCSGSCFFANPPSARHSRSCAVRTPDAGNNRLSDSPRIWRIPWREPSARRASATDRG